ncbi:MAG: ribosome-associated translation inhibitor RaiA [Phycisphaerales bacterium]|nr:ribosome-associated translation inhibitor RaiA [Phycisphaerales bacterium]
MRIEVSAKHMELTDAIREYADQKAAKLPRYYDGVQEIEVVFEKNGRGEFMVELRVDSEKHDTFVAKQSGLDVYECLDQSVDKMARQLTDFKEKLKNSKR